jgi:1-phosphofructokinase family hexose kinase
MIHTITANPAVDRLLMVPELKVGEHIQATRTAAIPAGKGVNVARYLQAMGEKATAWALVGCREVSWFREVLGAAGIGAGIFPTKGFTRQNITIVPQSGPETHLREPSPEISSVEWAALAGMLNMHASDGDVIVTAGSVPKGLTAQMLVDLLVPLTRKCTVMVDMNGPVARAVYERAKGVWFKGNREEIAELTGRSFSQDALVSAMEERPDLPGIVATAAGEEVYGAARLPNGKPVMFSVAPPRIKDVKSSVGAGDAFSAGFAMEIARGSEKDRFERALKRAVSVASASLTSAAVGAVDTALAEKLYGQIKIRKF